MCFAVQDAGEVGELGGALRRGGGQEWLEINFFTSHLTLPKNCFIISFLRCLNSALQGKLGVFNLVVGQLGRVVNMLFNNETTDKCGHLSYVAK